MKTTIKRDSKRFLFLFFSSICVIMGSIAVTMMDSLMNFFLVLMGVGSLLFTLSISETDAKSSELLSICSSVFVSAACFGVYFYFKSSGSIVTAKLFVLFGIFIAAAAIYSTVSIFRRRSPE
ncbi:MAG: hypothetical protein U9N46_13120 [Euryarchaeota archaeon]|nr:hypothetical protein [Euryarchaeota archaeon]